jgi:serine/threonine protein kinase
MAATDCPTLTLLGQGAFGKVFCRYSKRHNRTIVAKRIDKTKVSESTVLAEVEILNHLQAICKKNIICYIDYLESAKYFYIITEYLGDYVTLHNFNFKVSDKVSDFKKIINNLIQGLKDIHNAGVAHRDIKPENIMINPGTMDIKYIDFGLAYSPHAPNSQLIGKMGTRYYMAPEILHPAGEAPNTLEKWFAADYWALGMTILEIIVKQPFVIYYSDNILLWDVRSNRDKQMIHEFRSHGVPEYVINMVCNTFIKDNVARRYLKESVSPLLKGDPKRRSLPNILI